jgi:glycosyltransferase involved in cell wall biosynthesis
VDTFIARSEFSRDKHREFGFPREMTVLPYFLPGTIPARPSPSGAPSPHERPYFLFVGRLERIKGLDTVIPVFAKYADADLLVIGDGEEAAGLKALAAGSERVRFLGRVPNDQLGRYYEHAIAAIVPSVGFETFGIVLIEAFRYQTPVIARRIGPFPEIVRQSRAGLLFANDEELVGAMRQLQQQPQLRVQMGEDGYQACRTRWSEDVVVNGYLELVERAARERAAKGGTPPPDWVQ